MLFKEHLNIGGVNNKANVLIHSNCLIVKQLSSISLKDNHDKNKYILNNKEI